jgi:SAM-dependent methyltransferase
MKSEELRWEGNNSENVMLSSSSKEEMETGLRGAPNEDAASIKQITTDRYIVKTSSWCFQAHLFLLDDCCRWRLGPRQEVQPGRSKYSHFQYRLMVHVRIHTTPNNPLVAALQAVIRDQRFEMQRPARTTLQSAEPCCPLTISLFNPCDSMSKEAAAEDADGGQLARHGNFNNYYKFHPVDQRLNALTWLPSLVAQHCPQSAAFLDVGCNSGDLTIAIATQLRSALPRLAISGLGVDLDAALIQRCNRHAQTCDNLMFLPLDAAQPEFSRLVSTQFLSALGIARFDVTFLFSVTMWMHLHLGDDSFIQTIRRLADLTRCLLIVEPQEFRSYKTAAKRQRHYGGEPFPLFAALSRQPLMLIEQAIVSAGFSRITSAFNVGASAGFERQLLVFGRDCAGSL